MNEIPRIAENSPQPDGNSEDEADSTEVPFELEVSNGGESIYTALDRDKSQIRLLYINEDSCCTCHEICCDLYKVSFDDNPGYAALSYCWGNVNDKAEICLTGQPLAVPRALVNALRRLKEMPEDYFWVDAVCINQVDLDERASQVGLMSDIYSCAMMVYSYLSNEQQFHGNINGNETILNIALLGDRDDNPQEESLARRSSLQLVSAKKKNHHVDDERHERRTIVALDLADFSQTCFPTTDDAENAIDKIGENEEVMEDKDQPNEAEQVPRPEAIIPPPELRDNEIDLALFWCSTIFDQLQDEPAVDRKTPRRVQGMPVLVNNVASSIVQLLENRYWSRVWIFQEMVLAENHSYIGAHMAITAGKLETVCDWIRDIQSDRILRPLFLDWREWSTIKEKLQFAILQPLTIRHCRTLAEAIDRDEKTTAELAGPRDKLFQFFRHLNATDPHDQIYGILGVLQVNFRVDYKRSVRDLYISWCRWLARSRPSAGFKFLEQAGLNRDQGLNPHDLPSWVPDWSSPRYSGFSSSESFAATADISDQYVVKADGILHLDGMVVDEIMPRRNNGKNLFLQYYHYLSIHGHPTGDPPLQVLYRVMTRDDHSACQNGIYDPYNTGLLRDFVSFGAMLQNSDDDTFMLLDTDSSSWNAISWAVNDYFGLGSDAGDRWNPMRMISEELRDDELCKLTTGDAMIDEMLRAILDISTETFELLGDQENLLNVVKDKTWLFRTEKGFIGNSGPALQAGDLVCVLVGCKVPLIMRKVEDHYIIVEPAFVHGLMYGEAKRLLDEDKCVIERFEIR